MSQYFLGVDIGSTKSHALICNEEGIALGVGIGGAGNHESVGKEGFRTVVAEIIQSALVSAGITPEQVTAAGYGIAGYDWSEDTPLVHEVIESLPVQVPYEALNDAGSGLLAGSNTGWGVSLTAGTGVNARGRNHQGKQARMTGNGLTFGEVGGGTELVTRSIQDISRAWSMRGPKTALSDAFVQYAGAKDIEDLLAGIARKRYRVRSAAAPLVFQVAEEGDVVAQNAIFWLGEGLADLACGIIRQLEIQDMMFDVVLSGSIFQGSSSLLEVIQTHVWQFAPQAQFVHLQAPPVTGAVMLAMEQVQIDFIPLREQIISSGKLLLAPYLN